MVILGGWVFLMSEVPLYRLRRDEWLGAATAPLCTKTQCNSVHESNPVWVEGVNAVFRLNEVQGYLAHTKHPPP